MCFSVDAHAYSDESSKILFNSVRHGKEWSEIIVNIESIDSALKNGADPNYIDKSQKAYESVLSKYVSVICLVSDLEYLNTNSGCEALNMLFRAGAKLGSYDGSILYFPVANGISCVVDILLKHGASATKWDNRTIGTRLSPIEVAEANEKNDIVPLLISYGASPVSRRDSLQLRLINKAGMGGTLQDLQRLVEEGAGINTPNKVGETALLSALNMSVFYFPPGVEKVLYLLYRGADINQPDADGETPLNQLIRQSSYVLKKPDTLNRHKTTKRLIDEFIDKGAYVSKQDGLGQTPLHVAAKYNNLYAAQKLIKAGCKIMTKDFKGKTPLDSAESKEMIRLLKAHGAKEH